MASSISKTDSQEPGVLILVENLPVPLDRRVWQEARALRDAGYDVAVVCPQMRGYVEPFEVLEGIRIYRHAISGEASGIVGFFLEYATALWGETRCAWKAWRQRRFQVIHLCNPPDLLFLVALPYKLLGRVRVVFDVHDVWPEMFEAKFGRRGLRALLYGAVRIAERCTLAMSDVVIATNESVKSVVQSRGKRDPEEVIVVRTSPTNLSTDVPPNPSRRGSCEHLVGYIGVMGDADGIDYLLHAAKYVADARGSSYAKFCLMGSGPQWEQLVQLRDDLQLQEVVEMPGRVSDEFLCETLQTMDLGIGCDPINKYNDHCTMNKTLEYMAFGKPQVLFGIREGRVSAGDAAEYVDENSAEKLGQAIINVLDDPVRQKAMSEIAQQRLAGELSWSTSVKNLLAAYDRLLNHVPKSNAVSGRG